MGWILVVAIIFIAFVIFSLVVPDKRKCLEYLDEKEVPNWVRSAQDDWESRLGCNPYDMTKKFYGHTWIYEVSFTTVGQGQCTESWCRYLKNPKNSKKQ